MMSIRPLGLLFALLLVSACDKDPTPPKTPPAPQAPAVQQREPVAEAPKPAANQPAPTKTAAEPSIKPLEPLIESKLEPLPEKKPSAPAADKQLAEPSKAKTVTVRAPQPPDKIQRLHVTKPQTAAQQKASAAVKKTQVPKAKLDLRLPKELVKDLEPKVAVAPGASPAPSKPADPALLPQMFADKPGEQSPFEVGGRVITNERSRDQDRDASYFDTVDGAELQFKFRH